MADGFQHRQVAGAVAVRPALGEVEAFPAGEFLDRINFDLSAPTTPINPKGEPIPANPELNGLRRQPIPEHMRGPVPQVPGMDPVPKVMEDHGTRVPDMPHSTVLAEMEKKDPDIAGKLREARVRFVIAGYNRAAAAVFGSGCRKFWVKGDLARNKLYPTLLAAAEVMNENDIPPEEWCRWRFLQCQELGDHQWDMRRV
ncbi:MAG: hypothetical protein ABMA25_06725, partial [Ilumatobacteraceae bacterium]